VAATTTAKTRLGRTTKKDLTPYASPFCFPGTRISINQALEGSQADAVLSAFDGQYTVIRDVVLETNGVLHRILQIVIN
jgi:hypothetical protein